MTSTVIHSNSTASSLAEYVLACADDHNVVIGPCETWMPDEDAGVPGEVFKGDGFWVFTLVDGKIRPRRMDSDQPVRLRRDFIAAFASRPAIVHAVDDETEITSACEKAWPGLEFPGTIPGEPIEPKDM